jgi:hypothetical protein
MKHRSPLVTLAAVAVAFIIMFTVDVLAGPPGASSAQPADTSAPPAPASATSPSRQVSKTAAATEKPAGLYRARGSRTTIGWIVLEDGSAVGVQTNGADSTPAPELHPENPQVTVNGESLDAEPVNGTEDL